MTHRLTSSRLEPVRAQLEGVDVEASDRIDDWSGRMARAVMAGAATLPELAADGEDRDGFDPDTMTGEFVAYPTVLGRPYRMGFFTWHQLEPGAFDESIAAQEGGRLPVYVQHNWDWSERPPIGHSREAVETDISDDDGETRAVQVSGRIYPDVPDGLAVLHGMAARALREWSIGYLIQDYSIEEDDENARTVVHVTRAQLWEASVVLRGANPWTRTENVASDWESRLARAARLVDVSPDELAAALTPEGSITSDVDAELAARINALELRDAARTYSKLAHTLTKE